MRDVVAPQPVSPERRSPTLQRTVHARMPAARYRQLQQLADEELTTVSHLVRRLVCQGLDRLDRDLSRDAGDNVTPLPHARTRAGGNGTGPAS